MFKINLKKKKKVIEEERQDLDGEAIKSADQKLAMLVEESRYEYWASQGAGYKYRRARILDRLLFLAKDRKSNFAAQDYLQGLKIDESKMSDANTDEAIAYRERVYRDKDAVKYIKKVFNIRVEKGKEDFLELYSLARQFGYEVGDLTDWYDNEVQIFNKLTAASKTNKNVFGEEFGEISGHLLLVQGYAITIRIIGENNNNKEKVLMWAGDKKLPRHWVFQNNGKKVTFMLRPGTNLAYAYKACVEKK